MPSTELMTALPIASATFMPQWRQEFSRQAGGSPRVADLGPEIWTAKIQSTAMLHADAIDAAALVDQMRGSLDTFYVWDPRRPYPRLDPGGVLLGGSAVTIYDLGTDNKSLRLAGLPVGYVISRGDKLAWDQGTSPVRRCLHEFVAGAVADSLGRIAFTEVAPHIRSGASTGLAVMLKRPAAEMMIMPGSYDFPPSGPTTSTLSFTAIQVP